MTITYIAGHNGMVGSAIVRQIQTETLTVDHAELDLLDQKAVNAFFQRNRIDQVIIAAAKVGGILANNIMPAEFIYQNLMIEANIIHAAHQSDVDKLLFLGSSCIYPRDAPQPMKENALLTGPLELTNEPYAVAKIAGIKLCESYNRQYGRDYRSVMPTNLYGPGDNFHQKHSHVIPALLRRFHEAKISDEPVVTIWGSGTPKREFMYVDDMANACLHVFNIDTQTYLNMTDSRCSHINIGTGTDISIREVAELIASIVGYKGSIDFDLTKPDGTPRKLLDVSLLNRLGWKSKIELKEGLEQTYSWFKENFA